MKKRLNISHLCRRHGTTLTNEDVGEGSYHPTFYWDLGYLLVGKHGRLHDNDTDAALEHSTISKEAVTVMVAVFFCVYTL